MRYEDASHTAFQGNEPIARDDSDALPAGTRGPATGNVISGAGTQTGSTGADQAMGAHITSIAGKGGEDSSFAGGQLSVSGEFGKLSVDADGNYSYMANAGSPENVRDRFSYTLADNAGNSDTALLLIELGKTPAVIKANAQQIVPGPDGVVTLPPGVSLADVHIVGRNLVIDLPDGTQLVILDGAVFVPQLVLDGVEVPASNLAALLIGQEPQPAAGDGPPQSSGGNFDVPVPPLDPGIPLGDLIPPTEYVYIPPEPEEVFDILDTEPEAGVASAILDDDAQAGGIAGGVGDDAGTNVATGSLPGSGGDGGLTWDLLASGTLPAGFSFSSQPNGDVWVLQGAVHVLTVSVDPSNGNFTVTQVAAIDHPAGGDENNLDFVINYSVTDEDGDVAIGTLTVNVDDDTPTIDVTAASDANVLLTTQDAQTDGDPTETDTDSSSAHFGGIFGVSSAFGADGAGSVTTSYVLSTTGGASGLSSHGAAINLYNVGGVIVGSTAATAGAINASNTIFDISVNGSGVVTVNQYAQLDHPLAQDPTPPGPGYEDQLISLADGAVTLTRNGSITDGDGDTVTDSAAVGIGANIRFADDGPSIRPSLNEVGGAVVDESLPVDDATIPLVGGFTRGDDPHLSGGLAIGKGSTSGPVIDANAVFGADGPANGGGISYALDVLNTVSGLTTTEGVAINLVELANGVVVGVVSGTTTVAFAISIDSGSGVVTVEQYLSIFHSDSPDNFDEPAFLNEGSLGVTVSATDFDGDSVTSDAVDITSLIRFEDDGPTASTIGQAADTLVLDETRPVGQETDGDSSPAGLATVTANFADNFVGGSGGADGIKSTSYSLVLDGEDVPSGLFALDASDTSDGDGDGIGQGDEIVLNQSGNTITGSVNGTDYFTISVNPATGVVTFTQLANVWHGDTGSDDDTSSLVAAAQSLLLRQTITDGDNDVVSTDLDLSAGIFHIEDDGPTAAVNGQAPLDTLVVDETRPLGQETDGDSNPAGLAMATANFADNFVTPADYGTDGPGSVSYFLGLDDNNTPSGLYALDAADTSAVDGDGIGQGSAILLHQVGDVIFGSANGTDYFSISIDSTTGVVTFTQLANVWHGNTNNDDDTSTLNAAAGQLVVGQTVTDADGDHETATIDVSQGVFQIEDDGPNAAVNPQAALDTLVLDETRPLGQETDGDSNPAGLATTTANFADNFLAPVSYGTDGAGSTVYSLSLNGSNVASGLFALDAADTSAVDGDGIGQGSAIVLNISAGVITGSANGTDYFTISINSSTGVVTFTQLANVWHGNTNNDDDTSTLNAATNSVLVNQTVTDRDGDHDTASVDVSQGVFQIEDDGPNAAVNTGAPADTLVLDETRPIGQETDGDSSPAGLATTTANFADNFVGAGVYGTDGPGNTAYSLSLNGANVASGLYALDPSDTSAVGDGIGQGDQILLNINGAGTLITGAVNGTTYFTISINPATGEVTFTQVNNVWHANTGNDDDTSTLNAATGSVHVNQTVTDADGDHDSASIDVSAGVFQIEDDGPDAQTNGNGVGIVTLDETRGEGTDTPGGTPPSGDASNTINLAAGFVTGGTVDHGTDGPGSVSYSLFLSANGIGSGMFAIDPADTSAVDGDGIGRGTEITLSLAGNTVTGSANGIDYFTITINPATGVATFTQLDNIWHPTAGSSAAALDDTAILNTLAAANFQVRQTVTDADGDSDTASINIGQGVFQIQDDGPSAQNDVDVIIGGNGPATGNVITGVEVAVPEDGNGQDGVADDVGEDTPGRVSFIDHSNGAPGAIVPAGSFVDIVGDHGTLRMWSNGDYSYLRTDAIGGVSDVFTYTLIDADGDTVTATLTISIEDNFPVLPDPALVRLDDDVIPGANGNVPDGPGDDDPDVVGQNVVNGNLVGSGGDGDLDYSFTGLNTLPSGFSIGAGSDADTLLINQGATLVMTIQLNLETGAFTVTQNAPMLHPADNGGPDDNIENNFTFSIGVQVNDADNDVEPATITINVDDDTPTINVTKGDDSTVTLTTDDAQTIGAASDTAVTSSGNFQGVFGLTQSVGADGGAAASLAFALNVSLQGVSSGLQSHDATIFLYKDAGGNIVGSTSATFGGIAVGNTVFTVSVSGTGVVTLTQFQQVDHDTVDPTPTGGPPFADHIVSMADGLITLTASASLTDNDGDNVADSEVVNIGANLRFTDDGPDAALSGVAVGTVTLDETRAEGTDTTGGTPPTGDASATINFGANFVNGASVNYGADGAGSTVYALSLTGSNVNSGLFALDNTDLVVDGDGFGQGSQIVLNLSGNTITGSVGATNYFTITIDPATGIVTFTQLNNIWHPTAGSSAAALDDLATLNTATADLMKVIQTVTDFDGDTDTAQINIGRGVFNIQDDGPRFGPDIDATLQILNDATPTNTGDLDIVIGTDSPNGGTGNNVPDDLSVSAFTVEVNGNPASNVVLTQGAENATTASYTFTFDYDTGTGGTESASGTLVFNKAAGTYTVNLTSGPIEGFVIDSVQNSPDSVAYTFNGIPEGIRVVEIQAESAPDAEDGFFIQFKGEESATGPNPFGHDDQFNGTDTDVHISSDAIGVHGNAIQADEVLDFEFMSHDPAGTDEVPSATALAAFVHIDQFNGTEDFIMVLKLADPADPDNFITRTIIVQASDVLVNNAQIPDGYPTVGNNQGLILVEQADYIGLAGVPDNYQLAGIQFRSSTENLPSAANEIYNFNGQAGVLNFENTTTSFTGTTDNDVFKILDIGVLRSSTTAQEAIINFDVNIHDADGDTATQHITVEIGDTQSAATAQSMAAASEDTAPLSLMVADSQESQKVAANSNTVTMAAAVAAAGMAESAAAAPADDQSGREAVQSMAVASDDGNAQASVDGSNGSSSMAALPEAQESGEGPGNSSGHGRGNANGHDAKLDNGSDHQAANDHSSDQAANDQGPADTADAQVAAAPTVMMASAEALQAAGLDGNAHQGGDHSNAVEQVVAEALGHGAAPTVDGLLAGLPNGAVGALHDLASPAFDNAPTWDMGAHGGFASAADVLIKVGAEMAHHDAVQPAVNG